MNIVYGGSFNPPTKAHKEVILNLIKKFKPNKVIIVPCGNNYNRKNLIDFSYRFDMLNILTKNIENVVISDIEAKTQNYCGTLYTLDNLSKEYSDLYFVMGADNLITIKTWIKWEELLDKYHFIIFKRSDIDTKYYINNNLKKYKDRFNIIDFNNSISSTKIRDNIEENKELLDSEVYKYIKTNSLYKEEI